MDVQIEDYISVIITLILLAIWFFTLLIFNFPLISVSILWIGMILLSIIYSYIYRKKNRNMRILRIRFFVSAVPIYPILFFYIYSLAIGKDMPEQMRLIPFFVVFSKICQWNGCCACLQWSSIKVFRWVCKSKRYLIYTKNLWCKFKRLSLHHRFEIQGAYNENQNKQRN